MNIKPTSISDSSKRRLSVTIKCKQLEKIDDMCQYSASTTSMIAAKNMKSIGLNVKL